MSEFIKSIEETPEIQEENKRLLTKYIQHNQATQFEAGKIMVVKVNTLEKAVEIGINTINRLATERDEVKVENTGLREQMQRIGKINELELNEYKSKNITIDLDKNKVALAELKKTLDMSKSISSYKKSLTPVKKQ